MYILRAKYIRDILDDWNGDCEFVPSNDARVFFVAGVFLAAASSIDSCVLSCSSTCLAFVRRYHFLNGLEGLDARVFFAAWNGKPINPYAYTDFESLLKLLRDKL